MDDPPPPPEEARSRFRFSDEYATPKLLGAALAFLGGAVLVGWYLHTLELVTVPAAWVPMPYNTAVGFVLMGVAVVAHCVGRRRLAFTCGAVATGIGSIAIAELILGRRIALVEDVFFGGRGSGRMDPNTALCFSLAGCLVLVAGAPRLSRRSREMITGVLASLLAAGGFVGLMGFVLETDPGSTRLARFTHMELHTALAFMGLGVAFFAMVFHLRTTAVDRSIPAWMPWIAGSAVGILVVAIWVGLTTSEDRWRRISTSKTHEAAITHANQLLQVHLERLAGLSRFAGASRDRDPAQLCEDLGVLAARLPGLAGMAYLDAGGEPIACVSDAEPGWLDRILALPDVERTAARAAVERSIAVSDPTAPDGDPTSLFIAVPVRGPDRGTGRGELLFQHRLEEFFDAVFSGGMASTFDVEIGSSPRDVFYRSYDAYRTPGRHVSPSMRSALAEGRVAFGDRIWTIRGAANPAFTDIRRNPSNTLVLWVGLFLAATIMFAVRKSELLRQRAQSLAEAKRTIESHARSLAEQADSLRSTEDRLRRAAREKRRVLDSLSAFLVGVDGEGVVVEWNFVSSELFGLRSNETLGRPFDGLEIPWNRADVRDAIRECRASGERVLRDQFTVARDDGGEARVVSFTINPTLDGVGRRGFVIIGSDVTERQMLEMQLHNAQKLESVGTLAAGVAHEINTPMQFVSDNVRFVSQQLGPLTDVLRSLPPLLDEADRGRLEPERVQAVRRAIDRLDVEFVAAEIPQAIDESLEGIERITTIVRAMKDFSHPGQQGAAVADINRAIETTLAVARNEYKYCVDVETDLGDIPQVECWVADLNQVFLNLLVNGTHAIREKVGDSGERGTIRISTRLDGDRVTCRFSDTGTGIPEEVRGHVFDQFFTTKEIGEGTGLGLAIVRAVVVEKHGGTIDFESEVGRGTTFVVRLPLRQSAVPQDAVA